MSVGCSAREQDGARRSARRETRSRSWCRCRCWYNRGVDATVPRTFDTFEPGTRRTVLENGRLIGDVVDPRMYVYRTAERCFEALDGAQHEPSRGAQLECSQARERVIGAAGFAVFPRFTLTACSTACMALLQICIVPLLNCPGPATKR